MLKYFRTHLAFKVFLTYLAVILVGLIVLITATRISVPSAFQRHMYGMGQMMSDNTMMDDTQGRRQGLLPEYQAAVTEAITLAGGAALVEWLANGSPTVAY